MINQDLDLLFHVASHGDKDAYNSLYEAFVEKANYVILSTFKNNSKYTGNPGDFCEIIDDLFFKAINDFEPEKKTFSAYVDYLFSHKLVAAVKREIYRLVNYVADVDFHCGDIDSIEMMPDPTQQTVQSEIALSNFKLSISSPNRNKTQQKRLRDRVLALQYAGYKNKEICEKLNITYSQLRRIYEKMVSDEELMNIKLDLK